MTDTMRKYTKNIGIFQRCILQKPIFSRIFSKKSIDKAVNLEYTNSNGDSNGAVSNVLTAPVFLHLGMILI